MQTASNYNPQEKTNLSKLYPKENLKDSSVLQIPNSISRNQIPDLPDIKNIANLMLAEVSESSSSKGTKKSIPTQLSSAQAQEASRQIKALRYYYRNIPDKDFSSIFKIPQKEVNLHKTMLDYSLAKLDTNIFVRELHKNLITGDSIKGSNFLRATFTNRRINFRKNL
ncbi:MAG: hypothetical protein R3E95_08250 [Thiolinea sp.]